MAIVKPRVWIKQLEFKNGSEITFEKDDIVVFVGPNNAGKSASLKEAAQLLTNKESVTKVLKEATLGKEGTAAGVFKYLETYTQKDFSRSSVLLKGDSFSMWESEVESNWDNSEVNGLGDLSAVLINSLGTEERLTISKPAASIKMTSEPPSHPIHHLYKDDSLEKKFSSHFKKAFGFDLIVHRAAGKEIPLYVGKKPKPKKGTDRQSIGYIQELERNDPLHTQGDGMRSFVGVLLSSISSKHPILLIDEPEAFLHPPQARLLGKMLAENSPHNKQLFLATHSEDFLKGLLDAGVPNLKIIRIQRDGGSNRVSILSDKDIKDVWDDSLLRHSNVLGGLLEGTPKLRHLF